ncbi:histidinol-phosphatase [Tritonibacter horizontis]|uniref:Histidinol-phosphatase n=1 Tax=Tritonibacter horizontis TaxID=1768241 RepID=A0A132C0A8_9RHOB|nr:histidinol-phosphatase [Tritonibacter horizontis]KUP93510.1 histidinol-phosphatase [Tritonibacter horizontis]
MTLSDLDVARRLADAAGEVILPYFRNATTATDNKLEGGFDPVTVADRAAERTMRDLLAKLRPEDGILGEEFDPKPGTSGRTWVLDPIDGTRGFISGTPTWGVLIALSEDAGPILGIIDQPYIGERFEGTRAHAQLRGPQGTRRLATRKTASLDEAILFTTFPEVGTEADRTAFQRVAREVKLTRYGMDCYAYALLAAGTVDLVIEAGLNAYDIQGPIAVIEAAGGIVTNWEGGPAHDGGRALAAANPDIHAAALALLQED